ncbi:MAG: sulfate ABC transporter permease subunit CysT [Anaerolineae bacterium]|nr:MAG: sulfate ABC transporter permease subunit CysT [Anaerolineae bacterium]
MQGVAFAFLGVMVVIPLLVILQDGLREGLMEFWRQLNLPAARHALQLTLWTSALVAVINAVMGLLIAYVLVRYQFTGKTLLNAMVDLPLAIPTLVTGVMLVVLYGPQQPLGAWLIERFGLKVIFAPPGIVIALLFVTLPFVVRAVQPVLKELDVVQENAAATLGARRWTIFRRVVLPALRLPALSGALLSFSRAVGEFGAIVIVAGNIPMFSQTAAVYVFGEVESENRLGASVVSLALVAISFGLMNLIEWVSRRAGKGRV